MAEKILGIDLGTTNSAVALIRNGLPTLISVGDQQILPSVVGVSSKGEILVGRPARNQWVASPGNTVRSIKRKMGRSETVSMGNKEYTPQEISAFILRELRQSAEASLGEPVQRAVITVPAYFNELQRQATIEAGEIAGLIVERIINEPTASALAYGLGKDEDQRVLVYDLGGGTFDVSVIEMSQGVVDVLATAGDNYLGGDDFDELLADFIKDEFKEVYNIDLRARHQSWVRLLRASEEAKIELSSSPYATFSLEYIAESVNGLPLHINREVRREEFEELILKKLESTIKLIDKALADAELEAEDIDRVLLVGGSTRIPAVWEMVAERMKQEPHIEIDPDAAVALGASVQAGIIAKEDIDSILVDVTPISLGIESAHISFTGHLLDDQFTPLIRHNTTIPVQRSEVFTTLFPSQEKIHIKVYQGEEPIASENVLLGDFFIEELKPNRPDGLTEVTVNFSLDINGILDVTVSERKSANQVRRQLKASRQRLSPEDIARSQEKILEAETYNVESNEEIDRELDPGTAALLDRAKAVLGRKDLDPMVAAGISDMVSNIRQATAEYESEKATEYCDELIDLLIEAEE
jgi:molecular chaperone DnaK